MPIRPEFRAFYGRDWRMITRRRILLRAQNKCEQCGVPNHQLVLRAAGWWTPFKDSNTMLRFYHNHESAELFWTPPNGPGAMHGFPRSICRLVPIHLTIAHLNHRAGDDRDENLKALCQWCHLNYDKLHHHETRATRKDASRPLLQEAS